jgi:hypothetical protein
MRCKHVCDLPTIQFSPTPTNINDTFWHENIFRIGNNFFEFNIRLIFELIFQLQRDFFVLSLERILAEYSQKFLRIHDEKYPSIFLIAGSFLNISTLIPF